MNSKSTQERSTYLVAGDGPGELSAVVPPALLEEPLVAAGAVAVVVALRLGDEVVVQNLEPWSMNVLGLDMKLFPLSISFPRESLTLNSIAAKNRTCTRIYYGTISCAAFRVQ